MRNHLPTFTIALIFTMITLSESSAQPYNMSEYMPISCKQNNWHYITDTLSGTWTMGESFTADGSTGIRIVDTVNGCDGGDDTGPDLVWANDENGLRLLGYYEMSMGFVSGAETWKFAEAQASVGEWHEAEFCGPHYSPDIFVYWRTRCELVDDTDTIQVPAGSFENCLEISCEITNNYCSELPTSCPCYAPAAPTCTFGVTMWFARNVGIVKVESSEPDICNACLFAKYDEDPLLLQSYQVYDDSDCPNGSSCAGAAAASEYPTSPVHEVYDLGKYLTYFLLPIGAVIGLGIWRRKR